MAKRFFRLSTVSLTYLVINLTILIVFAVPILYAWHVIVEERRVERLEEDVARLSGIYRNHGVTTFRNIIDVMGEHQVPGDEQFILLTNTFGQHLAGDLTSEPVGVVSEPGTVRFEYHGKSVKALMVRRPLPDNLFLVVGRNVAKTEVIRTIFWSGFAAAAGVIILLGLMGRWLIRRSLLASVNQLCATADEIVLGDRSQRLEKNPDNELNGLIDLFSRMLDQIDQLIHGNHHVFDSIAHDLRTPLTELRFRLEALTLSRQPVDHVYQEIEAAIGDVDRVILIFNALLRLAEIGHQARYSGFEQINMLRLVDEVVDFYRPLAELKGAVLSVTCPENLTVRGDPLLLTQAIGNLIDNALKHTFSKVHVEIRNLTAINRISIRISDDGTGISDEDKPRVTERFFRSRHTRETNGVGLGLSLVVAVARLHRGTLELADAHPGLHATLLILGDSAAPGSESSG